MLQKQPPTVCNQRAVFSAYRLGKEKFFPYKTLLGIKLYPIAINNRNMACQTRAYTLYLINERGSLNRIMVKTASPPDTSQTMRGLTSCNLINVNAHKRSHADH